MALYCMADLHLSEAVEKPMDVFGRRWEGYRDKIIKNWNEKISNGDTVIVPGDISWGLTLEEAVPDLKLLSSLNGRKIIIKGNHDLWWQSLAKIRLEFLKNGIDNIDILQNNAFEYNGRAICGSRGWFSDQKKSPDDADYEKISLREGMRLSASIEEGMKLCPDTEPYIFLHFPPFFNGTVCEPIVETLKKYGIKRCWFGHIHNVYDFPETTRYEGIEMTVVSADYLNFTPIKIAD